MTNRSGVASTAWPGRRGRRHWARAAIVLALVVSLSASLVAPTMLGGPSSAAWRAPLLREAGGPPTPPPQFGCIGYGSALYIVSPEPAVGIAGTTFELEGSGYYNRTSGPMGNFTIWMANYTGGSLLYLTFVAAGAVTDFFVNVTVPSRNTTTPFPTGAYEFWSLENYTSTPTCANYPFTLTGVPPPSLGCLSWPAQLNVTSPVPATGVAGSSVTLQGRGFSSMGSTTLYWSNPNGTSYEDLASVSASSSGGWFNETVEVPTGYGAGSYAFWAVDAESGCAGAAFTLSGNSPSLALEPTDGPPGTSVAAVGTNFADSSTVSFTFDGAALSTTCSTNTSGSFGTPSGTSCTLTVPSGPNGDDGGQNVVATDTSSGSATATFSVTPGIVVSPTTGGPGTTFTVTGSGFSPDPSAAFVNFSGAMITPTGGSDCDSDATPLITLDSSGGFECSFTVPPNATPGAYTVQGDDTFSGELSNAETFTVPAALTITTTELASGSLNVPGYSQQVVATGGVEPYAWSATGLPADLTIDSSTGLISGTPVTDTDSPFTVVVTVKDPQGDVAHRTYSLAISSPLTITTTALASWDVNVPGYSQAVSASGGAPPYAWSATGLPPGLSIDTTTGVITGTPIQATGSPFAVNVVVADTSGATAAQTFSLSIYLGLNITTDALAGWTVYAGGYSQPMMAVGAIGPTVWSATGLAPGLSIDSTTGLITGTPTTTSGSPFTVVITVKDTQGTSTHRSYSLVINDILTITTTSLASGTVGVSGYSQSVEVVGGTAPYSWSATGLPPGLSIGAGTGMIIGIPTSASGSPFSVSVTVRDTAGTTAHETYSLVIDAASVSASVVPTTVLYAGALVAVGGGTAAALVWKFRKGASPPPAAPTATGPKPPGRS